jgi:hypothetical protein
MNVCDLLARLLQVNQIFNYVYKKNVLEWYYSKTNVWYNLQKRNLQIVYQTSSVCSKVVVNICNEKVFNLFDFYFLFNSSAKVQKNSIFAKQSIEKYAFYTCFNSLLNAKFATSATNNIAAQTI